MAAAPNASTNKSPKNGREAKRLSFAKITDTLTVPDLLALQTESFDWLVGNDVWKSRVDEATKAGRQDLPTHSGLEERDFVALERLFRSGVQRTVRRPRD